MHARVAGDEDAFVRDAGDAVYDVQRRSLALLLAAPRGPSTLAARSFEGRLTTLACAYWRKDAGAPANRGRIPQRADFKNRRRGAGS